MRDNSRVLLILCPPFWTKLPPLGIAYVASFLGKNDIHADVLDLNIEFFHTVTDSLRMQWLVAQDITFQDSLFDTLEQEYPADINRILDSVVSQNYETVGFSVFRSNRTFSLRLAQLIKERAPATNIIFGGPEVLAYQYEPEAVFPVDVRNYVDYMITGEGELAFAQVIKSIKRHEPLPYIIEAEECPDLDDIGYPRYEQFDLSRYERTRALAILTSRGCIRTCRFCAERLLTKQYRTRSVENIVAELAWEIEARSIVWFTFHDSLINGNLNHLRQLCENIKRRNLAIKWEAQVVIRPDMDRALLELMREAGCFNVFIGLESGSDTVLTSMHKGYTKRIAVEFLKKCRAAGLHSEISLIVGYPGEGEREFKETLTFLRESRAAIPKIAQVNPFIPLIGTPIRSELRAKGALENYNDVHSMALARVDRLVEFLKKEEFIVTEPFVNNVTYVGSKL